MALLSFDSESNHRIPLEPTGSILPFDSKENYRFRLTALDVSDSSRRAAKDLEAVYRVA